MCRRVVGFRIAPGDEGALGIEDAKGNPRKIKRRLDVTFHNETFFGFLYQIGRG